MLEEDIDIVTDNGLLVEAENESEMVKALKKLIENKDLREKFGSNSLKNVQSYDFKCYSRPIYRTLYEILNN